MNEKWWRAYIALKAEVKLTTSKVSQEKKSTPIKILLLTAAEL
jgi:hypothetical protein